MKSWLNTWCLPPACCLNFCWCAQLELAVRESLSMFASGIISLSHNIEWIIETVLMRSHLISTVIWVRLKSQEVSNLGEFLGQGSVWAGWLQSAAGVWNCQDSAWDRPKGVWCLFFFPKLGCCIGSVWSIINSVTPQTPGIDREPVAVLDDL